MQKSTKKNPGKYVVVRTYSAGVFAGHIESQKGKKVVLTNCRRLWSWVGAASLSQMAVEGSSNPGGCKFPIATPRHTLTEVIEIIETTKKAEDCIKGVPVWKA